MRSGHLKALGASIRILDPVPVTDRRSKRLAAGAIQIHAPAASRIASSSLHRRRQQHDVRFAEPLAPQFAGQRAVA
jgi:hypothetical protein